MEDFEKILKEQKYNLNNRMIKHYIHYIKVHSVLLLLAIIFIVFNIFTPPINSYSMYIWIFNMIFNIYLINSHVKNLKKQKTQLINLDKTYKIIESNNQELKNLKNKLL